MTYVIAVVIGVCMGSFGNVLVDRLPRGESILGRSHCDGCKKPLSPLELIPILSWIFLRGRCRSCKTLIPVRVSLVELFSGILAFAAMYATGGDVVLAIPFFIALWSLLLIAVIDTHTKTIPDVLTLVVFITAIAYQLFAFGTVPYVAPLILAGFFLLQWVLSRGRWVGSGDILLAAAIGMLVGTIDAAVWTLLASYAIGANVAIVLILAKKLRRGDMVPFGPFLVLAAYVVLLAGTALPPLVR